ncbi:MAG TPA: hypothetical protein VE172_05965, partial [Stackebrandtia sp.]|uniref:hypothetical protein n=1 Tax=Stackebrandtia sp. TaxID=2023065 RepID=UPI002D2308F1
MTSAATRRDLTDPDTDLPALQQLTGRLWPRQPRFHIGELTWRRFQHAGREPEWPTAWWERDGRVLAWGWAEPPSELEMQVDPATGELVAEVLGWFDTHATGTRREVTVMDSETHLVDGLRGRGYRPIDDGPFFVHLRRDLDDIPRPVVPRGYRLRPVRDESDAAHRAAAHAAAFSIPGRPSRVTETSYRQLMRRWPYDPGLDWMVTDADDRAAAFCLIWMDEENA